MSYWQLSILWVEQIKLDRQVRISLISIAINVFLTSVKGTLAFLSGSLAILADAYHSFSHLIVSGMVLTGILLRLRSERKVATPASAFTSSIAETNQSSSTSKETTPGYWVESEVAYFVSLIILCTAYQLVPEIAAGPTEKIRNIVVAVVGVADCIAIAYVISRFKIMAGHETDSPGLIADGYHSRMAMFTSTAVLLSILSELVGVSLERPVAVLIFVVISITGINLFVCSFVSAFRKSPVDARGIWELVFSLMNSAVGVLSEHIFRRKISLPEVDLSRLNPNIWFSRRLAIGLIIVLAIAYLGLGITTVQPDEAGVRFRYGAIVDSKLEPGLQFALPWPFEKIVKVKFQHVYRLEVGFRTDPNVLVSGAGLFWETKHKVPGYRKKFEEVTGVTGDISFADLSLVVHYQPMDTVTHLYRVCQIHDVMHGLTEACMREVLASESSQLLMTENRLHVLNRIKEMLQSKVNEVGLGVAVLAVLCHDVHPPIETLQAFRDIFSAREDRMRYINEGKGYRNQNLPRVRAKAEEQLAEATCYETEKRLRSKGEAQRFLLIAEAYKEAPEITGYRFFLEAIEESLYGKKKYIANPRGNLGGYGLWLFKPPPPPKKAFETVGTPVEE
jgi:HflK protein